MATGPCYRTPVGYVLRVVDTSSLLVGMFCVLNGGKVGCGGVGLFAAKRWKGSLESGNVGNRQQKLV